MATARVNGSEIHYEESGSGPPIILSAGGLQGVASSYQLVVKALAQEHRVVVYDRRFGGRSRSPLVVQTWDMVCDDLFGLMDTLGIDGAYLGGGSFGAATSLGCASRRPERCAPYSPPILPEGSPVTGPSLGSCSRAWTWQKTRAYPRWWTPSIPTTGFHRSARK